MRARVQDGAGGGNRTPDPLITNQLLYLLSYASRQTLNIYAARDFGKNYFLKSPSCRTISLGP